MKPRYSIEKWDKLSSVRKRPLRNGDISETAGLLFPLSLDFIAAHPLLVNNPSRRNRRLAYSVLDYLDMILLVEQDFVIPVSKALTGKRPAVTLSSELRGHLDLVKTDEDHHTAFIRRLANRVKTQYGLEPLPSKVPKSIATLRQIRREKRLPPRLLNVIFVCQVETIVGAMNVIPSDPEVVPGVREVLQDHLDDEVFHAILFSEIFVETWKNLSDTEKDEVGRILPQLLSSLLSPDREWDERVLRKLGYGSGERESILQDVYSNETPFQEVVSRSAAKTMKMFRRAGVFSVPSVIEAFNNYGISLTE